METTVSDHRFEGVKVMPVTETVSRWASKMSLRVGLSLAAGRSHWVVREGFLHPCFQSDPIEKAPDKGGHLPFRGRPGSGN
ncbi:MAG: hypothetical protein R3F31_14625 [Verrucomicrobiales bacterium]